MALQTVGNYSFRWTELHLSREETDPLRHRYDELGSEAVKALQRIMKQEKEKEKEKKKEEEEGEKEEESKISSSSSSSSSRDTSASSSSNGGGSGGSGGPSDMFELLRRHHGEDEALGRLWRQVHEVPEWVDWQQIERGQKFLYRFAPANLIGFALQGFVGENSAASGVTEVLVRTGGFSTRALLNRLLETFQFLLQATKGLESIQPGGEGHASTVRVRLLHSSVRERILGLTRLRPDYYDVDRFGPPVNTLDSIHSISTFCCNHMWLQLPQMGVYPTEQEKADYIALFRYIGYLLATPDAYFATTSQAKATMESMLLHELHVTDKSLIVGHNFVQCVRDLPPLNLSAGFIEAGSRVLNGDQLCDSLGFRRPGLISHACFRGHCWFVAALALAQRCSPALDDFVVRRSRALLHHAIIHSPAGLGKPSKFAFKHVPQLGKQTYKEDKEDSRRTASSSSSSSSSLSSRQVDDVFALAMLHRPLEAFYFVVFLFGVSLALGVSLAVLRIGFGHLGRSLRPIM